MNERMSFFPSLKHTQMVVLSKSGMYGELLSVSSYSLPKVKFIHFFSFLFFFLGGGGGGGQDRGSLCSPGYPRIHLVCKPDWPLTPKHWV